MMKHIDIEVYDISKCFDKMSFFETANDMFNIGVKGDKFVLLTKANENSEVSVRTPWGSLTKKVNLKNLEMQGTVVAPIKCAVQIDSLGKHTLEEGVGVFKYKGCLSLPPLSMIDDILTISKCPQLLITWSKTQLAQKD